MKPTVIWILGIAGALAAGVVIAYAGSQQGRVFQGLPIFALCFGVAFLIQWLMFIPAFVFQTERYFDLTGSLTYISLVAFTWVLTGAEDPRALLVGGLVILWALRLGSFLFLRILRDGEDRRFRSIKPDFLQFFMVWTLQGLWVSVTLAAGLVGLTTEASLPLDIYALVGGLLWLSGFCIEVAADLQKSRFKADHPGEFINVGLWRVSRHPNYFGEIVLWIGIAIIALPVMQGWQYVALISPVFVVLLLTKISGVRMLEHRANKQWGEDPAYREYVARTPVLIPRLSL